MFQRMLYHRNGGSKACATSTSGNVPRFFSQLDRWHSASRAHLIQEEKYKRESWGMQPKTPSLELAELGTSHHFGQHLHLILLPFLPPLPSFFCSRTYPLCFSVYDSPALVVGSVQRRDRNHDKCSSWSVFISLWPLTPHHSHLPIQL